MGDSISEGVIEEFIKRKSQTFKFLLTIISRYLQILEILSKLMRSLLELKRIKSQLISRHPNLVSFRNTSPQKVTQSMLEPTFTRSILMLRTDPHQRQQLQRQLQRHQR